MRCFYVLVHGRLRWLREPPRAEDDDLASDCPVGFYCHRYVLGVGESEAKATAFARVRENLEKQTRWIGRGYVRLDLEAEEVAPAPLYELLKRDNRGHAFYLRD